MITKDFSQDLKIKLNFVGLEQFDAKGKHYFVYYFQVDSGDGYMKLVKVISDVAPEVANSVIVTSFNNQISLKVV
jgi:hypothetical protein